MPQSVHQSLAEWRKLEEQPFISGTCLRPLDELGPLVDDYPLLQSAVITSSQCYEAPFLPNFPHRYLLLRLNRNKDKDEDEHEHEQEKPIWVRLERMPDRKRKLVWGFASASHDREGGALGDSLDRCRNRQAFRVPLRFKALCDVVNIIIYKLTTYRPFSWNCWFFVSLLQQNLEAIGEGYMEIGRILTPYTDQPTRDAITRHVTVLRQSGCTVNSEHTQTSELAWEPSDLATYRHSASLWKCEPSLYVHAKMCVPADPLVYFAVAYRYICQPGADRPISNLEKVLECKTLDALYLLVLRSRGHNIDLAVQLLFFKLMASFGGSLPVDALIARVPAEYFPPGFNVQSQMRNLYPVICGLETGSVRSVVPVAPCHPTFLDLLKDPSRSEEFYVDSEGALKLCVLLEAADSIFDQNYIVPDIRGITQPDIELFVHSALRSLGGSCSGDRSLLAHRAEGSLRWAAEACRAVMIPATPDHDSRVWLHRIAHEGFDTCLDTYYATVIGAHCNEDGLEVRLQFLKLMLSTTRELPLADLLELPPPEYFPLDVSVPSEVQHLSAVIRGVEGGNTYKRAIVTPYSSTFVDFLSDAHRSGQFYIDPVDALKLRTLYEDADTIVNTCILPEIHQLTPRDIDLFVHQALRFLGSPGTTGRSMLAHKAQGSLHWAVEACRAVTKLTGTEDYKLARLMLIANHGLDAFYGTLIEQHSDGWQFKGLLESLSLLFPLQTHRPSPTLNVLADPPSELLVESSTSSLDTIMGALRVALHGSTISHTSFWDFLMSPQRGGKFHLALAGANATYERLAEQCIKVMNNRLRFNIAGITSSYHRNQDVPDIKERIEAKITPLLVFCCRFWPVYASYAFKFGSTVPSLFRFMENRTLQWLEVMSLTQRSPESALAPLSEIASAPPSISILIADITHFVKMFAKPISISTPHIYASALAFVPKCSVLSSQVQSYPGIVRVVRGRLTGWPVCLQILEGHSHRIHSVAFSPDSRQIASSSHDGAIRQWDARTGATIGKPLVRHTRAVHSIAFSPQGTQIASCSDDGSICLWKARTGKPFRKPLVRRPGEVRCVAFSPDGAWIVSASWDAKICLWNSLTGKPMRRPFQVPSRGLLACMALSPDGSLVALSVCGRTIYLWDLQTGTAIQKLRGHSDMVNSVAFSPDGTQIASGSDDKTVRLWDIRTGGNIGKPLVGHTDHVYSVAFSPDGARIASGGRDRTVRLWDTQKRKAIGKPLVGHSMSVCSVVFSPNGARVASGGTDGVVRLWDTSAVRKKLHKTDRHLPTFGPPVSRGSVSTATLAVAPPSDVVENWLSHCSEHGALILKDGWVVGKNGELLLWVPPTHREQSGNNDSPLSECLFTLHPRVRFDFRSLRRGEDWNQYQAPNVQ